MKSVDIEPKDQGTVRYLFDVLESTLESILHDTTAL